ncbi:MaoC family dehydratase [Ahrensia marina]|jgi:acyl dehydratase|uniref:Nodulation protein NodN n=1 Tax=Ahrensia marina TaxID=1514904 RepID=A0A0N0E6V2_9HYPH|nr:MaoC family dehydratase [Ahrensia marina]KPB00451.1 nodulation protein NodN [Ahrensia marina]
MTKRKITLDDIPNAIGTIVGTSDWRVITQEMIDKFADATDDHQWIHCDPERAEKETPFGSTIAHGFLTLSMLSTLTYEALPELEGATMGINYGFDKIRFMAPVRSGAKVRAVFKLQDADIRPSGRVLSTYEVTLEIDGSLKPAFTATWLTLAVIEQAD